MSKLLILIIILNNFACAYRFTRLHVSPPQNIRSIAFEAVFDTSQKIIAREHLWLELQKEFTNHGVLSLENKKNADAILIVHLRDVIITPSGTVVDNDVKFNKTDQEILQSTPPRYDSFRYLNRAGNYSDKEQITALMNVKIFNLNNKQLLFSREYTEQEIFLSTEASSDPISEYINYEEKLEHDFKNISKKVAKKVVQDFFYSL